MAVLCRCCDWIHHRRSAGMGGVSAAIGELTLLGCITAGDVWEAIATVVTAEVVGLVRSTVYMRIFQGVYESCFSRRLLWVHSCLSACFSHVLTPFAPVAHRVSLTIDGSRYAHDRPRSAESLR